MREPWWKNKRRRWTIALLLGLAAIVVAAILVQDSTEDDELGAGSAVELAPPKLLDDGAGQRHFEVSYPPGPPRGTMILIHGAGWASHSQATFSRSQVIVTRLLGEGFRVVAISTDESPALSRAGAPAAGSRVLDDVLAFHDQVSDAFPDEPVCSFGISGGGHLSLLLATQRELACASAAGPPTDLVAFVRDAKFETDPAAACKGTGSAPPASLIGFQIGACLAVETWGSSNLALRRASPALRWSQGRETPVWAGFEQDDPVIPDSQRRALRSAVPGAVIEVLRNDPKGPGYVHSGVRAEDKTAADADWLRWLNRVIPPASGVIELPDEDLVEGTHAACNSRLERGASWRTGRRRDRSELLNGAGRWRPQGGSAALYAVSSCDGREDLQESGLVLSAPGLTPGEAAYVENGESAAWTFKAPEGSVADSIRASFRGFIAHPGIWRIGLYQRTSAGGNWRPVAECDGRSCEGLQAQSSAGGTAIVPAQAPDGADLRGSLPEQTIKLDRAAELRWELTCVGPRGCVPRSINPGANPDATDPLRRADPTGRPAVLSLYELEVDVAPN